MGGLADAAGIQFRMLNRSRGPAVWGPRAQCDRALYARLARGRLEATENLTLLEGMAEELTSESGRVTGALTADGRRIAAGAVVVTTGTFLNGLMHTGARKTAGGRVGEAAAAGLSGSLARLGLALGRFKTGTPPRVHRDSIDYDACRPQPGDDPPVPFSFRTRTLPERQALCWLTATNRRVHALIREHLHESPMYSGQIHGTGPRYCPSVEDKVVKFADKSGHTIFLEPDGVDSEEIYINGLSTSLPEDVQRAILAEIPGLTRARMIRPGYAVEYDFVFPQQLSNTLEALEVPRTLSRRTDQRHVGLRGGGGAGTSRRDQRRARGARRTAFRPRAVGGVRRGDGRRSDAERRRGALSPLHLARGVPAAPRRRHRAPPSLAARAPPRADRPGRIRRRDAGRGAASPRRRDFAPARLQPERREPRAAARETRNRDRCPRQRI